MHHVWLAAKALFWIICLIGAAGTLLWLLAVFIGVCVQAKQERARARRRASNYRVGGVISGSLLCFLAFRLHAQQTQTEVEYEYTAAPLAVTSAFGDPAGGPLWAPQSLSGDVILAQALNPNQANQIVTPVSFEFQPFSSVIFSLQPEDSKASFEFSTANGNITSWTVGLYTDSGPGSAVISQWQATLGTPGDTFEANVSGFDGCLVPQSQCAGISMANAQRGNWVDPPVVAAPELDFSQAMAMVLLMGGGLAVVRGRRPT